MKEVRICRVWFVPHRVVYTTTQCIAAEEILRLAAADARVCQDTCCESFQGRSGDSAKNTMKSGCTCTQSDIRCEATNCMHNQNCVCHAEKVDIAGAAACRCDETECVTFEEK